MPRPLPPRRQWPLQAAVAVVQFIPPPHFPPRLCPIPIRILKCANFALGQKTCEFCKTHKGTVARTRKKTLQEAAVCQIPIGFLQIFLTFYPPDMPSIPPTLTSHPDRRPPRLKDSPGLGGALTPSKYSAHRMTRSVFIFHFDFDFLIYFCLRWYSVD